MAPEVSAAIISGVVALTVGLITYFGTRANFRRQMQHEGERLAHERDQLARELANALEGMRQAQATELLRKRMETYPDLYRTISEYGRNWQLGNGEWNLAWVSAFLEALLECNAKHGVYFSDDVYGAYGDLREVLCRIRASLATGDVTVASDEDIKEMFGIIRDKYDGKGLGTYMKDDLGGFILGAASLRVGGRDVRAYLIEHAHSRSQQALRRRS